MPGVMIYLYPMSFVKWRYWIEKLKRIRVLFRAGDFAYKKSPFQGRDVLILSACFVLTLRIEARIRGEMEEHRRDREAKGHYRSLENFRSLLYFKIKRGGLNL